MRLHTATTNPKLCWGHYPFYSADDGRLVSHMAAVGADPIKVASSL